MRLSCDDTNWHGKEKDVYGAWTRGVSDFTLGTASTLALGGLHTAQQRGLRDMPYVRWIFHPGLGVILAGCVLWVEEKLPYGMVVLICIASAIAVQETCSLVYRPISSVCVRMSGYAQTCSPAHRAVKSW